MKRVLLLIYIILFSFSVAFAQNKEQRVRLLFVGDAMQHMPQILSAEISPDKFDYGSCFENIKDIVSKADISCLNLETVLGGKPYKGYPCFSSPDQFAIDLKKVGFNIFFLANNHSYDRGKRGLERTIKVLDSLQIKHTGTFINKEKRDLRYPLMIKKNGIRIAFLNYTYGTNGINVKEPNIVNLIDKQQIEIDIENTKLLNPDIIIAGVHWGEEYQTRENRVQRELASFLTDKGVSIIIGSHPHVVQPTKKEIVNDTIKHITTYSLGNFISAQRDINSRGGMMCEIEISKMNNSKSATIESYNETLFWVKRYYDNGKEKFKIVVIAEEGSKDREVQMEDKTLRNMFIFEKTARKTQERYKHKL